MKTGRLIVVRTSRLLLGAALAVGVAACGDERPFSGRQRPSVEGAPLTVPTRLTPPVRVEGIAGAPRGWNLNARVAQALRQRDIPAGTGGSGRATYVLRGDLRSAGRGNVSTQLTIDWTLVAPDGSTVGTVSQLAALPGAGRGASDDLVDAIADAAAESVSPLVPSANLARAEMPGTGERPLNGRRRVEGENPVTAIGRMGGNRSPISRNLMAAAGGDEDGGSEAGGQTGQADPDRGAVTAVARMRNSSTLSRNLMERGAADRTRTGGVRPGSSFTSSTTSSGPEDSASRQDDAGPREYADVSGRGDPPAGSMEELFRQEGAPDEDTETGDGRDPAGQSAGNGESGTTSGAAPGGEGAPAGPAGPDRARSDTGEQSGQPERAEDRTGGDAGAADTARTVEGPVWWVQVGAFRSREEAAARWQELSGRAPDLLGGKEHRITRVTLEERGVWHRVQIGPIGAAGDARRLCGALKRNGMDCFLVRERQVSIRPQRERRQEPPARQDPAARQDPEQERRDTPNATGDERERTTRRRPTAQARRPEQGTGGDAAETPARSEPGAASETDGPPARRADDGAPITTSPGIPGVLD